MIAAGFFWLSGCTPTDHDARDGGSPPDSGPPDDAAHPVDAGPSDAGSADGGTPRPTTPPAPEANFLSDIPCAFPASLAPDADGTTFFVACGGASNALYRSPPIGGTGPWSLVGIVGGYPSNHLPLSEHFHAVGHSFPDGITIVDADSGAATAEVELASLAPLTASGQPLAFAPNTPWGMVLAGGQLCMATSNLDHMDAEPSLTTFYPGTIICMPWNGDGTLDAALAHAFPTSGVNPTGMALIDGVPRGDGTQRFAVLSSNSYADAPATQAALEICEMPSMACTAIPLGNITAQISPQLHVTGDGIAIIGVQKPAPAIIGVDTLSGDVAFNLPMPDVQNFIASITSQGGIAVISDFGPFGAGGSVLFKDLRPTGWTGVPVTALEGSAGPSAVSGGMLYQAVTSNDATTGSLWWMDLGGLE